MAANKDLVLNPFNYVHTNLLDTQNEDQIESNSGELIDPKCEEERGEVRVDELEDVHLLDQTVLMVSISPMILSIYKLEYHLFVDGTEYDDD